MKNPFSPAAFLTLAAFLLAQGLAALPANCVLYAPGAKNPNDVKADLEANGFTTLASCNTHFSFVDDTASGRKVLKLNTIDGQNEYFRIPLSGSETRITLIFKAKGAVVPDTGTPYGVLWAAWQRGAYQAVLRHNTSNQIKGSTGQTGLNPENIVSDWHEYRLVFELASGGTAMTATAFVDGKMRHRTENYEKKSGDGNYAAFGENDGSTNGIGRYPWLLLVKDEDVSGRSLKDLSALCGLDLSVNPVIQVDPDPASRRPARKPAGINMTAAEAQSRDPNYVDPAFIANGTIDLSRLPYSRNAAKKVTADPPLPAGIASLAAATVDPSGAGGAYRTIGAAIDAVKPGAVILVRPGLYYEKLKITKADIHLFGTSPANTVIYGYEADLGGIDGNVLVDVMPGGGSFSAENITFYNKGPEWNATWGGVERRSIALAARNLQQGWFKNCVFLGQQDTMYLRSGRQCFENCYIEGEVDFLCGGATVLFSDCHIHSIFYKNGGYVTASAPSDTEGAGFNNGYVFNGCLFTADPGMTAGNIYLGRGAWTGGSSGGANQAKVVILRSVLHGQFHPAGWLDWDNNSKASAQFYREYENTGAGAVAAETPTRKLLTRAEYEALYASPEKILGYAPKRPY